MEIIKKNALNEANECVNRAIVLDSSGNAIGFDPVKAYNELREVTLEDNCAGAAICLLNGEYQNARFILDFAAREGSVQAMYGLARMLIYALVPDVDFDLDIYPLIHKAANHCHLPSMWMLADWLGNGIIVHRYTEHVEFLRFLLSKLDPNGKHCHPLVPCFMTKHNRSILVRDVVDALDYNPDDIVEPESVEEVRKMFFTKERNNY